MESASYNKGGRPGPDGYGADAVTGKLLAVAHDALAHRFDVRTVIADEHDEQSVPTTARRQVVARAVSAGEIEVRRFRTETRDRRLQARHAKMGEWIRSKS